MQSTYHIKGREVDTFIYTLRSLVQDNEEVPITVTSESTPPAAPPAEAEQQKRFKSVFGSWQGDELVQQIYSARTSSTRHIKIGVNI